MNFFAKIWHHVKLQKQYFPLAICDRLRRNRRLESSKPYWDSLKNKHKGRRGFVIGNGPSLKMEDLERLKGEITIASNKIYLAFDQLTWRPDYYTVCDMLLWTKVRSEVNDHIDVVHVADYLFGIPLSVSKKIRSWRRLDAAAVQGIPFSDDLSKGAVGGGTVTFENLQLAVHLGLNPIYIIGCDHYYAGESVGDADKMVPVGEQCNHFIKGYRKPGEIAPAANIDKMNLSYQRARDYADQSGISIFNATRGGFLDTFERADFDSVVDA